MKVASRTLWIVLAVALLVVLVAAMQVTATPAAQTATATPAPTKAAPVVDTKAPTIPGLKEWQASPHADFKAEAFRHWDQDKVQEVPASCAKCHSSGGYQDFLGADGSAAGKVDKAAAADTVVDCVACHNAATVAKTSVVFPSGIELTGLGDESRCMECHQGRESKLSVDKQITDTFKLTDKDMDTVVKPLVTKDAAGKAVTTTFGFRNVHYFAAAATQYGTLVKGGYEYEGMLYDGKFEHPAPYNTCNGCHNPHTLELDLKQCATCHTGVKTAEDLAKIRMNGSLMDYDGDGDAKEGVAQELAGLQDKLLAAIKAYAKEVAKADIGYDAATYPYFFTDKNADGKLDKGEGGYSTWTARLLKAAYNYQVATKDPGQAGAQREVHHPAPARLDRRPEHQAGQAGRHREGCPERRRPLRRHGHGVPRLGRCRHGARRLRQVPLGHRPAAVPQEWRHGCSRRPSIRTTGVVGAEPANGFACTTCHNDLAKFTLYPVTSVPFPSGKSVTFSTEKDDKGNLKPVDANLCLECHQGRQSTAALNARIGKNEDDKVPEREAELRQRALLRRRAPRCSAMMRQVAYQYADKEYVGRNMHAPGFDTCTGCHATHELGLNFDKCVACHAGVKSADDIRFSANDLDGDKDVKEGAKAEIMALEEKLYGAMQAYAKTVSKADIAYDPGAYPYFFADANANGKADKDEKAYTEWTPRLLRAAYNYQYVQKDPGIFAHNPKYAGQILFDTLESLNGAGGLKVDMTGLSRPEVKK